MLLTGHSVAVWEGEVSEQEEIVYLHHSDTPEILVVFEGIPFSHGASCTPGYINKVCLGAEDRAAYV